MTNSNSNVGRLQQQILVLAEGGAVSVSRVDRATGAKFGFDEIVQAFRGLLAVGALVEHHDGYRAA